MNEIPPALIKKTLYPPFSGSDLNRKANSYATSFRRLIENQPTPTSETLSESYFQIQEWLQDSNNKAIAAMAIGQSVNILQQNERDILSESHDLLHLSEMVTCLLDDKARNVDTEDATVLLAVIITLLHDLGRHTEKQLTHNQIDLSTNLHHDVLSFRSARKILRLIGDSINLPDYIENALSLLTFNGLINFGKIDRQPFFAVSYDTDRRQLLGSPVVGRDITYFGGMVGRDLSPRSILNMPPGYTHYDSGGFFGQQNTMARNVFRDEAILTTRKLDEVFDPLAVEATTIMLLACGEDKQLQERTFDVDLGLIKTPNQRLTQDGLTWWPKKPLPASEILTLARGEAKTTEEMLPYKLITPDYFNLLITRFVYTYSTIVEPTHLVKVRENIQKFTNQDRLKWARILYYSHRKNQERYARRRKISHSEQQAGTFLAKITKPFINIINSKQSYQNRLDKLFI